MNKPKRHIIIIMLCFPLLMFANNPIVRNVSKGVELSNDHVSIVISNKAELVSFVDLLTNTDVAANNNQKIAYVKTLEGKIIEASQLYFDGNNVFVTIGNHKIILKILAFNDYFTVEVQNRSIPDVEELTFFDVILKNNPSSPNSFCATGIAMSLQTNPVVFPSSENKEVIGKCNSHTGIQGSKLAIIACRQDRFWGIVRSVYLSLPSHSVPVILSSGGPFAYKSEANRYDGVILSGTEVANANVTEWIDFYSKIGIKHIAFYLGPLTFIQGQFSFPKFGNVTNFKERVVDPLSNVGIISSLHTYSYYISYSSDEILKDPKWQQQLEFRGDFKLVKDVGPADMTFNVSGDVSVIKNPGAYSSCFTPFILIDNEIVRYEIAKDGFVNCKRGQCGTEAKAHKKGAKAKVIGGYFHYIAPQIGSDLYYEIARRTAKVYNEGGFKGFYFDALDGLGVHLKYAGLNDYHWYYGAAFINEVLKYCDTEPQVLEASHLFPTVWSARGRGESWDTPVRGYKNFINDHIARNKSLMRRQYYGTLGWYDFYPKRTDKPGNFSTKYMFADDVDYLGVQSIAYDQAMMYDGLLKKDVENNDALKRNLETFAPYSQLRVGRYFSERVKNTLREGSYEYKLARRNGKWGFYEAHYCRTKLRDVTIDGQKGNNPFKQQKPFVRLENMYTSDCSSPVSLMKFNENADMTGQQKELDFSTPVNLSNHLALKISLKGSGTDSKDAICVRLRSEASGFADYIVRLNFDGWRDVVLPNLDNAEYPDLKFPGMDDDFYKMHRKDIDFSSINHISVFKSSECGIVYVKSIDAVPLVSNSITNPKVSIGNASVTFVDTLQSGEYVEYTTGEKTALAYNQAGKSRSIKVKSRGRFRVPHGAFTATVSGTPERKDCPSEVVLTLGLFGQFIQN